MQFMDLVTTSNMLPTDKDVWNRSLTGLGLKFILNLGTLLVLVHLDGGVGLVQLVEESLGLLTIPTNLVSLSRKLKCMIHTGSRTLKRSTNNQYHPSIIKVITATLLEAMWFWMICLMVELICFTGSTTFL